MKLHSRLVCVSQHIRLSAVPEPAVKEKAWARFTSPEAAKESLHDIEAEMGGFYDRNNRSLTREYNDKFFAVVCES